MLHLRVVCPVECTDLVLDLLRVDPGAVNLAILRGAALDPLGDLIICDLAREGVNDVLTSLRGLGIHESGSIALEHIAVSVSEVAETAEANLRGYGSDAAVWEDVDARVRDESVLSAGFLVLIVIAAAIAAVGLVEDAPILIIGAMVVGPEFGPMAGLSVGLFKRRMERIRVALVTLVAGLAAASLSAFVATVLMRTGGYLPDDFSTHTQPLTSFVVEPSMLSFAVALLAGVAGTLSLTQAKAGALIGVLISVTTIPAVAAIGVAGALGHGEDVLAAALQLGMNVAALILAGVVTLWVQREAWERLARTKR